MALLLKRALITNPYALQKTSALIFARNVIINDHFKPGPYPRTTEERAKAAKKYGLLPEEYETFPEDEQMGDYPKLPDIGTDSKDPYYPWDNPEYKRNFNEPMHYKAEMIGWDRYDISVKMRVPLWEQWLWFLGVMGGAISLYFFLEDYKFGRPVTAKQYPKEGKHYSF
ncbi:NADH dehydrogenase 1 beta subcomplex subunit 8, mitochondrial [Eumeta japonica]|uniref:NADH dehydrogenase 1 beta subcomplex subunit 8, mitochondrial n=1 Tax=Eumeta variegata TaxID=151549 RepID=A0A4C1XW45_EUMVA|nr:NADH dehydrogenase 1 beta subcomplex subunit 8, mitochondrial [Eumeta japonica]